MSAHGTTTALNRPKCGFDRLLFWMSFLNIKQNVNLLENTKIANSDLEKEWNWVIIMAGSYLELTLQSGVAFLYPLKTSENL